MHYLKSEFKCSCFDTLWSPCFSITRDFWGHNFWGHFRGVPKMIIYDRLRERYYVNRLLDRLFEWLLYRIAWQIAWQNCLNDCLTELLKIVIWMLLERLWYYVFFTWFLLSCDIVLTCCGQSIWSWFLYVTLTCFWYDFFVIWYDFDMVVTCFRHGM